MGNKGQTLRQGSGSNHFQRQLKEGLPQCGPRIFQTFSCHITHALGILAPKAKGDMCRISHSRLQSVSSCTKLVHMSSGKVLPHHDKPNTLHPELTSSPIPIPVSLEYTDEYVVCKAGSSRPRETAHSGASLCDIIQITPLSELQLMGRH